MSLIWCNLVCPDVFFIEPKSGFIIIVIVSVVIVAIRPGTRLFNNWRLIEYLKEATRSARLGTRSVLGAAGKVEI